MTVDSDHLPILLYFFNSNDTNQVKENNLKRKKIKLYGQITHISLDNYAQGSNHVSFDLVALKTANLSGPNHLFHI